MIVFWFLVFLNTSLVSCYYSEGFLITRMEIASTQYAQLREHLVYEDL